MIQELLVIKIGGNILDDEARLADFLQSFAFLNIPRILIHGGGKLATELAGKLGIEQQMVDGRRITDKDTLNVVTMVYAGLVNKTVVAGLQRHGCNALGLSGADGNVIRAHKRTGTAIDFGFAGDIEYIDHALLKRLIEEGVTPVLSPITHDGQGQLLNTNADTIAQETARAMSTDFNTTLVYCFEKAGVLTDVDREDSVIALLDPDAYRSYTEAGKIFAGMIPKLDNAFSALRSGVSKVIIGQAERLHDLVKGQAGTTIIR